MCSKPLHVAALPFAPSIVFSCAWLIVSGYFRKPSAAGVSTLSIILQDIWESSFLVVSVAVCPDFPSPQTHNGLSDYANVGLGA